MLALLVVGGLAGCGGTGDAAGTPTPGVTTPLATEGAASGAADPGVAQVHALLAAGELRAARTAADVLAEAQPGALAPRLLQAHTLRYLHDRGGSQTALEAGYRIAPAGFPALASYVDHQLRGPNDPKKGLAQLAFLDTHLAAHPGDARLVAEARLVVTAYLLWQKALTPADRATTVQIAEASLLTFTDATTTDGQYNRAQALLGLGRVDEAVAAARAGIAIDDDRWEGLVMGWAVALLALHAGDDAGARAAVTELRGRIESWEGTHFGMGKPLVELVQLTSALWWGETPPAPADYEDRIARLARDGARLQVGDAETRELLRKIMSAREAKDAKTVLAAADDVLAVVARDGGCEMENQVIRPHTEVLALVVRADALAALGDAPAAEESLVRARALFPASAWLRDRKPTP